MSTPVTPVTHMPRGEFTAGLSAVLPMLLGAGFGLWITWKLSCAAGIVLGGQIPAAWSRWLRLRCLSNSPW